MKAFYAVPSHAVRGPYCKEIKPKIDDDFLWRKKLYGANLSWLICCLPKKKTFGKLCCSISFFNRLQRANFLGWLSNILLSPTQLNFGDRKKKLDRRSRKSCQCANFRVYTFYSLLSLFFSPLLSRNSPVDIKRNQASHFIKEKSFWVNFQRCIFRPQIVNCKYQALFVTCQTSTTWITLN